MQPVCSTDGLIFQTNQTRFAAALVALGFELIEKRFSSGAIVTFEFNPTLNADELSLGWRYFDSWKVNHPTHSLTYMRRVSDARDWIVHQVVNGNHNERLTLPAQTYKTSNLNEACCLVANDFYLLKLEKDIRQFHFPIEAAKETQSFRKRERGSSYYWQWEYLQSFYWLMSCISRRKLTRQPKK